MADLPVDAVYVCPHERDACDCRKPDVGLFRQAQRDDPDIDLRRAVLIGDAESDMEAGRRLGCRTIRVGGRRRCPRCWTRPGSWSRVKVIIANPPGYGGPDYDDHICTELAALGVDVELVTSRFRFGDMPEPAGYRRTELFYPLSSRAVRPLAAAHPGEGGRAPARPGPAARCGRRTSSTCSG